MARVIAPGRVVAVGSSATHSFSKRVGDGIHLLAGLGVEGDAHCGATVRHRSHVARDPTRPNLRQVHLLHEELFAELAGKGFAVRAGQLGENVTTRGLDLLSLPVDAVLRIGPEAIVRLTGLRNPCVQLDRFRPGLLEAVLDRSPDGRLVLKAGVMGVVEVGGRVRPGDAIEVALPEGPHRGLERV